MIVIFVRFSEYGRHIIIVTIYDVLPVVLIRMLLILAVVCCCYPLWLTKAPTNKQLLLFLVTFVSVRTSLHVVCEVHLADGRWRAVQISFVIRKEQSNK